MATPVRSPAFQLGAGGEQPVVLLQADRGSFLDTFENGQKPRHAARRAAAVDLDGFEAHIERRQMRAGDAILTQERGGELAAEFGPVLQHLKLVPCIERDGGLQHGRKVVCRTQDLLPFIQARILIPVGIIDQRVAIRGSLLRGPVVQRIVDQRTAAVEQRINVSEFIAGLL